jgi:hypothetical protein
LRKSDILAIVLVSSFIVSNMCLTACRTKPYRESAECFSNLRRISSDWDTFFGEHSKFITDVSTNQGGTKEYASDTNQVYLHFRTLKTYVYANPTSPVPDVLLLCPQDPRGPAPIMKVRNENISYFMSMNATPGNSRWILSGTRNLKFRSKGPIWNAQQGLHRKTGYLLYLDSTIEHVGDDELAEALTSNGNQKNQLALP